MPSHYYTAGRHRAATQLGLLKQASLVAPALLGGSLGAATGGVMSGEGNRLEGAMLGGALGAAGGAGGAALGRRAGAELSHFTERELAAVLKARQLATETGALAPDLATPTKAMLDAWRGEPVIAGLGTAAGTALGMGAAARMAPGPAPQPNQDPYGYYR